jgi:hypothetical protein
LSTFAEKRFTGPKHKSPDFSVGRQRIVRPEKLSVSKNVSCALQKLVPAMIAG